MKKDTKQTARNQARAEVVRRYDARVASFDIAVESRRVDTYAGEVHLLITGLRGRPAPDDLSWSIGERHRYDRLAWPGITRRLSLPLGRHTR